MISCTRKLSMKCVVKGCLLLFLVFITSTWWINSKSFTSKLQDVERKKMEVFKKAKIEELKRTKIEMKSDNIEGNEIHPIDIIRVPASTQGRKGLHRRLEHDQKYEKLKERSQNRNIDKDKRPKIESISNDIEENETYPIDIRYFPPFIERKLNKSLRQTYDEAQKYVEKLKQILQADGSYQGIEFEDDFLRSFVISNDNKIDQALPKIQNFLNLRIDHEYFFHNVSFDFTKNPVYRFVTISPHRRKDGSVTVFFELGKWDPDKVPLLHLKQILFMIIVQALRHPVTQASGLLIVCDFADVGFRYLKYFTPQNMYLLSLSFDSMPTKYLGFHFLNINFIGNMFLKLLRPFLPKFIQSIFYTHSSVKELLDFFPASMLPVQYGGNLTEPYAAEWIRRANQQHGNFPLGGQKNVF